MEFDVVSDITEVEYEAHGIGKREMKRKRYLD